jgi:hypothetical protein
MTNRPDIVIKNTKEKTYFLIVWQYQKTIIKRNEAEKSYNTRFYLFLKIYCKEGMYSM